jgi:hypothetical protein
MKYHRRLLFLLLFLFLAFGHVLAHAPLTVTDNGQLSSATIIENPEKSWVVYSHLHEAGDFAYYRLYMRPGERLVLGVNVNTLDAPVPDLIVMGPGIDSFGTPPASLEIPPGSSVRVISGTRPKQGEYEPFSPSVIYEEASFSMPVTQEGTYYAVVYTPAAELNYNFVVGYKEEFTVSEWLLIPFSVLGIYQWEGQSLAIVLAPVGVVLIIGIGFLFQDHKQGVKRTGKEWLSSLGGLLYVGGAAVTLTQMGRALSITGISSGALLTMVFIIIPVVLGFGAIRIGRRTASRPVSSRIVLVLIAGLGFLFWAGYLIGPLLLIVAVILPDDPSKRYHEQSS